MIVIIDTNVPLVANGKAEQASPECVNECTKRLNVLIQTGKLVLDSNWLIIKEYRNKLQSTGQPGVGDKFLKWVLTNYKNNSRCEMVNITEKNNDGCDFEEFPDDSRLENFDPDDRKFVAVSIAHAGNPPVLQAVDTQWWRYRDILAEYNVKTEFLCEKDILSMIEKDKK
jgi:hypothetical protein